MKYRTFPDLRRARNRKQEVLYELGHSFSNNGRLFLLWLFSAFFSIFFLLLQAGFLLFFKLPSLLLYTSSVALVLCHDLCTWYYSCCIRSFCSCSVPKSFLILCDPMDCSWADSSVYGILLARIHRKLYKKDLHDPDNHNGVITHLEPEKLECKIKWALQSITANNASGGDRIPAELFQS